MTQAYGYDVLAQDLLATTVTVPASTTLVLSSEAKEAELFYPRKANVRVSLTRNAAAVGTITLYFAAIGAPGLPFPNIPSFEWEVNLGDAFLAAQSSPTNVVVDAKIDADDYYALKLLGIRNNDASHALSIDSAKVTYKR